MTQPVNPIAGIRFRLPGDPQRFQQGLTPVSFRFLFSEMSLPGAGGAETYIDRFLAVGHDAALDRGYFLFDQDAGPSGSLDISVIENRGDGEIVEITSPVRVTEATTEPVELPVQGRGYRVGRPLYLRLRALPGAGTPFWGTALEIAGTLWFLTTD